MSGYRSGGPLSYILSVCLARLAFGPSGSRAVEMRCLVTLIVALAACCPANADLGIQFGLVDNSDVESLAGYVTQDLVVSTTTDWLTAQIILTVADPPSIYQDIYGGMQSPNPILFDVFPSLAYDTYISSGTLAETCNTFPPAGLGGTQSVFDEGLLSIAWGTTNTDEIGDLALARITLADNATGTWDFQVTAAPAPGPKLITSGRIVDGVIYLGGDVSADGFVGQDDLDILLDNWGASVPAGNLPDLSGDGFVGQDDLDVVLRDWGRGAHAHSPEPITALTMALGLLVLARRARRKAH